jgi:transposase-like protein
MYLPYCSYMTNERKQRPVASDKSSLVARLPHACRDENAAVEFMEEQRWGAEPSCPRCGVVGECYKMTDRKTGARSARYLWRCRACGKQYTLRVGTVLEDSRIPLMHWCLAFWLACASKKGVSALQIKRLTGLSYKSALFMMHRVRYAMAPTPGTERPLTGTIEADETYVGGKPRNPSKKNYSTRKDRKACVVGFVERGGDLRPMHVDSDGGFGVRTALVNHVDQSSRLLTDESGLYRTVGKLYAGGHETVKHSAREYARGDVHTNTIEGFFSLLKRGMYGTFHSVSKKHLHRYLSEFQYRYNTRSLDDGERTARAMKSAEGKRLTYKQQTKN